MGNTAVAVGGGGGPQVSAFVDQWAASVAVKADEFRYWVILGTRVLLRNTGGDRTTGATFDAGELSNWELESQTRTGTWSASTPVPMGFTIMQSGMLWEHTSTGTTAASWAADQANWTQTAVNFGELEPFLASDSVYVGELRRGVLQGVDVVVRSTAERTAGTSLNSAEIGSWELVSQRSVGPWVASSAVMVGTRVTNGGIIWESTVAGTTAATFSAVERANWTRVGAVSSQLPDWIASYPVQVGEPWQVALAGTTLVVRSSSTRTTGATTFDATEAANWTLVSQRTTPAWVASTVYLAGQRLRRDGVIYERTAIGTSGAAWDATERALWTVVANSTILPWSGGEAVAVDEIRRQVIGTAVVVLRSLLARTTGATFTVAEAGSANWKVVGQDIVETYTASTVYPIGVKIRDQGITWERKNAGTSAATFSDTEKAEWTAISGDRAPYRSVSASHVVKTWDEFIDVDTSAASVTVSLPLGYAVGKHVQIHKSAAANTMTVSGTIISTAGALVASEAFTSQYVTLTYTWTGSYWALT